MPVANVNGVRLAYEDEGSGPPLVLVHGSWTNRHGFDLVAPGLSERFRVVRHDRRGHSESEAAEGTLQDDAADIAALAEALDLGPFHVACSSRGGVIGLKLAAAQPDVVSSIVCHEPPLTAIVPKDAPQWPQIEAQLANETRVVEMIDAGDHEGAARFFVDEVAFGRGAWDRMTRFLRGMFVENAATYSGEYRDPDVHRVDTDALSKYPGRALLTTSDDSPPWFGVVIEHLAEVLPRVERHVYRGGGHNPQGSRPQEYIDVVGDFVARAAMVR
jgi:pimeloyl-ACP methyl ester carboxylesterase